MHIPAEPEAGRTGARHQVTLEVDCGQETGVMRIEEIRQQCITGLLGLRELRASQATIDVVRNVVTIP